jgi:hypothetical protein
MAKRAVVMGKTKVGLSELLGKFDTSIGELPPVDSWTPELSGNMDMTIKANGDWVHEGDIIERDKLSRLFSSIIKNEGDDYFLVTPVEKWRIQVEDQPFTIALCEESDKGLTFITNMGEEISLIDPKQLLTDSGHEAPKILVRKNLYARLNRPTYYQIIELAKELDGKHYIESNGCHFYID